MRLFGSRRSQTAEAPVDELLAEIEELAAANRDAREPERERRILQLRHRAGAQLAGKAVPGASFPEPAFDQVPQPNGAGVPEVAPGELTPVLLRGAMLQHGCLLVRGLLDRDDAVALRGEIDRAIKAREAYDNEGVVDDDGYFEPFEPGGGVDLEGERAWVAQGGLWAADSPRVMAQMLEALDRAGLRKVIHGYLGERPAISIQKCTLRKVDPDSGSAWHQDGAFLGQVRALNVWLSLSRCGDESPGLDIVPRRLEEIVPTGTEGATFDWSVAPDVAEQAAGEAGVARPIFEPGDVLLFDEMNLHSTAADPSMPNSRFAVESWFFGLSGFPSEYVPIAY